MEKVSRALEGGAELSTNSITSIVSGKGEHVGLALELLVSEGYVSRKRDGQRQVHRSVRPFREDADV